MQTKNSTSGNYPPVHIIASGQGGRGNTMILMYTDNSYQKELGSDAMVKTPGSLESLLSSLNVDPSKLMTTDREAVEVLKLLSPQERNMLANKERVVTRNISPAILQKYNTNRHNDPNLKETKKSMTVSKKTLKQLIRKIIAEDFKGNPNDAAEVESDNLTATLSENDVAANIADLENLIAHPDVAFAKKNYGSVEAYQNMLRKKIEMLKRKTQDEPGMGPEYRVRSDEPSPFGYGLDELTDAEKAKMKSKLQDLKAKRDAALKQRNSDEYKDMHPQDQNALNKRLHQLQNDVSKVRQTILGLREKSDSKLTKKDLDQTKDGTIDTGDAVVAARKEKIAQSKGDKKDATFYSKIKNIVNKRKGHKV